jgi:hypothetical protein
MCQNPVWKQLLHIEPLVHWFSKFSHKPIKPVTQLTINAVN